jgi:hypothetical protein
MDEPRERHTPEQADDIARAIVEYLRLHPQAADTMVGIARWWLGPSMEPMTRLALERLVASGEVVCEVLGDGQCVFRRGPQLNDETRAS